MGFTGEFLGLPGLRGYWPMNTFDGLGNAIDQSGNARTLTYNGNPTYTFTTQGGPYIDLDGTGDYLSRADEGGLDILGTESYIASAVRGLTTGAWIYADSTSGVRYVTSKDDNSTQRSWLFYVNAGVPNVLVFDTASTSNTISGSTVSASTWTHLAMRFTPSTELSIFKNGAEVASTTTSIKASIMNSTVALQWGAHVAGELWDGRLGMTFLCAMALSDTAISNIYNNTKASYGL